MKKNATVKNMTLAEIEKKKIDINKHSKEGVDSSGDDIFQDINYICGSTSLIVDSLQKGLDVAQLSSGDIIVTEVKTINTHYAWDQGKKRMVRVSQSS